MTNANNYIWQPFTQMKLADAPIHIVSGKDTLLVDKDGKQYIDAISSWWVNLHGHANSFIADSISAQAQQLEHVIFAGFTHSPAMALAEGLIKSLPSHFSKVFYSDNGSTSVEVAVKMALQYWYNKGITNKPKIIAFDNAYHGDTFGAMSVGGKSPFNKPFQEHLFEVDHLPLPDEDNITSLKTKFHELAQTDTIAAFIFEPLVQGAGGMLMYKAEYLDELIAIAQSYNIICIADEVMTGFGRTGKTFAINHLVEQPDIICLSKGITGGFMPLSVTICTQDIYNAFYADEKEKAFFHGHSYTANPIACAAANASLSLLKSETCQAQIKQIVNAHKAFADKLSTNNKVKHIRQLGTIIAFEINTPEGTSYFNAINKKAYNYFIEHGVLLRPLGNVIYIMPPYCITSNELAVVYSTIEAFLAHL